MRRFSFSISIFSFSNFSTTTCNSCISMRISLWVFGRFRGGCDSLWDRSGVTSTTIGEDSLHGSSPPNIRWKFNLCEFNLFFKKIIYTYNQVAEMNSFRQPPAEFSTNSPSPTLSPPPHVADFCSFQDQISNWFPRNFSILKFIYNSTV